MRRLGYGFGVREDSQDVIVIFIAGVLAERLREEDLDVHDIV